MIRCEKCGGKSTIRDSRPAVTVTGKPSTRRRRHCLICGFRWTTLEVPVRGDRRVHVQDAGALLQAIAQNLQLILRDVGEYTKLDQKQDSA